MPLLLEELPEDMQRNIIYQHDGAPAHFGRRVRAHLHRAFPDNWIGRGGPVNWPARSPDLTPLDYFLWGYIKNYVYKVPINTEDELMERLHEAFATLQEEMLLKAVDNVRKRCRVCVEQDGWQFEQILKKKRHM